MKGGHEQLPNRLTRHDRAGLLQPVTVIAQAGDDLGPVPPTRPDRRAQPGQERPEQLPRVRASAIPSWTSIGGRPYRPLSTRFRRRRNAGQSTMSASRCTSSSSSVVGLRISSSAPMSANALTTERSRSGVSFMLFTTISVKSPFPA
jgi:hypothetical protein